MDVDTDTHSSKYAHDGRVLLGSATLLFFMCILLIFLHTCSCSCFRRRHLQRRRHHNRHFFLTSTAVPHTAPDPSLFKLLPTFTYSSAFHLHLQECSVCLSEFEEDEEGRVLPNCSHYFHTHCIETWFRSHSNCPICRALVHPPKISPNKTDSAVSDGEFAGCSYLPPPISCPRKELDFDMLSVVVEFGKEETGENKMSSESGPPGYARLKSSAMVIGEHVGVGPSTAYPARGLNIDNINDFNYSPCFTNPPVW